MKTSNQIKARAYHKARYTRLKKSDPNFGRLQWEKWLWSYHEMDPEDVARMLHRQRLQCHECETPVGHGKFVITEAAIICKSCSTRSALILLRD